MERLMVTLLSGSTDGREARPFYCPAGDEVDVFLAAARRGLPVLLKGPTGCGKTRFGEAMAYELGRELVTVAGHEDLTSADLVGRFLLKGGELWGWPVRGPVRFGTARSVPSTRWWRPARTRRW